MRHRRRRAPRLRHADTATTIAALLFLLVTLGIIAALLLGRSDVAGCYSGAGNGWC